MSPAHAPDPYRIPYTRKTARPRSARYYGFALDPKNLPPLKPYRPGPDPGLPDPKDEHEDLPLRDWSKR